MASRSSLHDTVESIRSRIDSVPGCLVVGPDRVRRERVLELLRTALREKGIRSVRRWSGKLFDGRQLCELSDSLKMLSLFEPKTAHLLSEAHDLKVEMVRGLASLVESASFQGVLLIEAEKLTAQHPLRKLFSASALLIELPELSGAELVRWVERELKARAFQEVGRDVPRLLIERCSESVDEIAACVEQLSLFLDGGRLTTETVSELYPADGEEELYTLIDPLIRKQSGLFLKRSAQLLRQGVSPFAITTVLHRSLGQLLQYRFANEQGRSRSESTNMPPWLARRIAEQASRITTADLLRSIDTLLAIDSKMKNRALSMESVLSELLSAR